jgi:histidine triad (HIT) family protein
MATIFTRIINGEIPSYRIAEDERFYAFLDINPLAAGHTLVVPKQETDYLFDLDPDTLGALMQFAQRVAGQIKQAIDCKRIAVVVLGLEVPHAHIHLIPLNAESDVDFRKPKLKFTPEQFEQIAANIRQAQLSDNHLITE